MANLYIDHILIAVQELSIASKSWESLGFKVTPEGNHPGRGTHNRLIVFRHEYLELIAINDDSTPLFRPSMRSFLKSREGLFMFAIGTDDIDGAIADLRSRGVEVEELVAGARNAGESPGYTWKSANLYANLPGTECFLIEHDQTIKERYTLPQNPTVHDNGISGLKGLTLAVNDADKAAYQWKSVFGLEEPIDISTENEVRRCLRFGNTSIYIVSPTSPGPIMEFIQTYGEGPFELSLQTPSFSTTLAELRRRDVDYKAVSNIGETPYISISSVHTSGVTLRIT